MMMGVLGSGGRGPVGMFHLINAMRFFKALVVSWARGSVIHGCHEEQGHPADGVA